MWKSRISSIKSMPSQQQNRKILQYIHLDKIRVIMCMRVHIIEQTCDISWKWCPPIRNPATPNQLEIIKGSSENSGIHHHNEHPSSDHHNDTSQKLSLKTIRFLSRLPWLITNGFALPSEWSPFPAPSKIFGLLAWPLVFASVLDDKKPMLRRGC